MKQAMTRWMAVALLAGAACGGGGGDPDGSPGSDAGHAPDAGASAPLLGRLRVHEVTSVFGGFGFIDGELVLAGLPAYHAETMNDGTCRLLEFQSSFCDPPCDQGWCVDGQCQPFPAYVDAGTLTVTGLKTAVAADPALCGFNGYGYCPSGLPADLYDPADSITASAPGGDFPGFSVTATGVAPLAGLPLGNDELDLPNGGDLQVTWTPQDGEARVHLTINANSSGGHGSPYQAILECDSPDDGSLTIPQAMIEAFPETYRWEICAGSDCPLSSAVRYTRGLADVADGQVELQVGARRDFYVIHPAP